ncbi:MAG: SufS family cysteine desulfurase [Patescibacteria group bacterium]
MSMFDAKKIRNDFPQFNRVINGKPIVYLDSTATSLKPQAVIDAITGYYTSYTANVFRGIYTTSEEATAAYEKSRELVATFINASSASEIVFTRNTSESINLVASSFVHPRLTKGDEVVTTIIEHHSNIVPWQVVAKEKEATLKIWDTTPDYVFDLSELPKIVTKKTKVFAISAASNVLGYLPPIKKIIAIVKSIHPDCIVVVDAAQAVAHMKVDVQDWDADFVAFSGHKMLGPTGIGVLWGKKNLLDSMEPYQYGGDMISAVYRDHAEYKEAPHKFEAGTPHIAGVIGLGAAVLYLSSLGMDAVRAHEKALIGYALGQAAKLPYMHVVGPTDLNIRGGVLAFTMDGVHPHDIAQVLNERNICVRAGNHCAMPLHAHMGVPATTRASLYVYTTTEDIDALITALIGVKKLFS